MVASSLHAAEAREFLVILVSTPFLVGVCAILEHAIPHLLFIVSPLWMLSVFLDVYTTWRFYRLKPEKFEVNERNPIYARLVARFGFKAGSILQFVLVEVPLLIFFAFFPIPVLYWYLAGKRSSLQFSLSAAMTLFLAAHFHASRLNIGFEKKNRSRI